MSDRLEEIKERQRRAMQTMYVMIGQDDKDADADLDWLISEVERLVNRIDVLENEKERLKQRCLDARRIMDECWHDSDGDHDFCNWCRRRTEHHATNCELARWNRGKP